MRLPGNHLKHIFEHFPEIEIFFGEFHLVGFDLGEIENIVNDFE